MVPSDMELYEIHEDNDLSGMGLYEIHEDNDPITREADECRLLEGFDNFCDVREIEIHLADPEETLPNGKKLMDDPYIGLLYRDKTTGALVGLVYINGTVSTRDEYVKYAAGGLGDILSYIYEEYMEVSNDLDNRLYIVMRTFIGVYFDLQILKNCDINLYNKVINEYLLKGVPYFAVRSIVKDMSKEERANIALQSLAAIFSADLTVKNDYDRLMPFYSELIEIEEDMREFINDLVDRKTITKDRLENLLNKIDRVIN